MVQKRRLLWVGDAGVATGFANCTHETLKAFHPDWDVHVLGINYSGDPHPYPYAIYPCFPGGDYFGVGRLGKLTSELRPDLVVIQADHWNVPEYLKAVKGPARVIASMPVDGENVKNGVRLNALEGAIFWTRFGLAEAREGGYTGPAAVVGLGVDSSIYHPVNKSLARQRLRLPIDPDDFLVGNINRNQPRKRLDLTIKYFAKWVQEKGRKNARLLLHHSPRAKKGYDLPQLARYYGLGDRVIFTELVEKRVGMPKEDLCLLYSALDIQISTTQGEGWGLTTMEGMACCVPQIVPEWAALAEWPGDAVWTVPCSTTAVTVDFVNVIGGIADERETVAALDLFYVDDPRRFRLGQAGLERVSSPEFDWQTIALKFRSAVEGMLG